MNVALPVILFVVGFAAGGGAIWLVCRKLADERVRDKDRLIADLQISVSNKEHQLSQRDEENTQLKRDADVLRTTLEKEQEKFAEEKQLLSDAQNKFKDAFRALAADALKDNTEQFDKLYSKPVTTTLEDIKTKIARVDNSAASLGTELSRFVKVLQRPEVRGQWGEMHLERVLEITGMTDRCDYVKQQVIGDNDCRLRPDVIVKLPGDKQLAVDSKATLQAFLDVVQAPDENARQDKLRDFVNHVRERVKILGSKAYHQSIDGSPEFVVLFLPTEGLFSTALTLDPELLEFADSKRVLLAGPINLIALLRAVAHGWKQDDVANNAREICTLAEDLYRALSTYGGHMGELGKQLTKSVGTYNAAVGSLDGNVIQKARRFEKLGAAPDDSRIPEMVLIEEKTRSLRSDEFAIEQADGELEDCDALARPR